MSSIKGDAPIIHPSLITGNVKSNFKQDIIKHILTSSFEEGKTKLSNDALSLITEIAKCLCIETSARAAYQAIRDGSDKVDIEHLEKCLPQLLLDFP